MELKFEQALNRLIEIVDKLEESDVGLEESLALYKEGISLSKNCGEKLTRCESEVMLLQKESEAGFTLSPFDIS